MSSGPTSLTDREAIEAIRELSKGFPSALAHLKIIDILSRTNKKEGTK